MPKRTLLIIISIAAIIALAVFIYRFQIIRYSAEVFIRKSLPSYVKVDSINFDARGSRVTLSGFKISAPRGFSDDYILEIGEVSCRYKLRGKNITEGFEIFEPVFKKFLLNIERLEDGCLNLNEMSSLIKGNAPAENPPPASAPSTEEGAVKKQPAAVKLSDIIKLPENYSLKNGTIIFLDRYGLSRPHIISFENINASLFIKLDDNYSKILSLSSQGQGEIGGNRSEIVRWNTSLNPTAPKLTMSNRFDVYNVKIKPFEPYYDKYSPLVFTDGTFSGLLIFDFDNGNIGSSNEIRLSNFRFYVKPGQENAQFWQTSVPELVKYFSTPYGEIVFDFKIKGDMKNPVFYLGPKSKEALTALAVDKISAAIQDMSKSSGNTGKKTDLEKAKQYIDMFKGVLNKK